jgi:hypothetical protein
MVKAKEFWDYLCNELDYRFFSGIPCLGLKSLYDEMSPKFMHYIPAANERIALGLVSGAWLSGTKGAVLISSTNILEVINLLKNFNNEYKIPILIICYADNYDWAEQDITSFLLRNFEIVHIIDDVETFKTNLNLIINEMGKKKRSGIFFVGKGDIK